MIVLQRQYADPPPDCMRVRPSVYRIPRNMPLGNPQLYKAVAKDETTKSCTTGGLARTHMLSL